MTGIHSLLFVLLPQFEETKVLGAIKIFIKRITQNIKRKGGR